MSRTKKQPTKPPVADLPPDSVASERASEVKGGARFANDPKNRFRKQDKNKANLLKRSRSLKEL